MACESAQRTLDTRVFPFGFSHMSKYTEDASAVEVWGVDEEQSNASRTLKIEDQGIVYGLNSYLDQLKFDQQREKLPGATALFPRATGLSNGVDDTVMNRVERNEASKIRGDFMRCDSV